MSYLLVRFSIHAIERYVERVKPALDRDAVLAEMIQLIHLGQILPEPPAWLDGMEIPDHAVAFLEAGDVVMPLVKGDERSTYCATTVLTPGGIPEATRESRNRSRSRRGQRRRAAKNAERRFGKKAAGRIRLDGHAD